MPSSYTEVQDRKYKKVETDLATFSGATTACLEDRAELITRLDRVADFRALEQLGTNKNPAQLLSEK